MLLLIVSRRIRIDVLLLPTTCRVRGLEVAQPSTLQAEQVMVSSLEVESDMLTERRPGCWPE